MVGTSTNAYRAVDICLLSRFPYGIRKFDLGDKPYNQLSATSVIIIVPKTTTISPMISSTRFIVVPHNYSVLSHRGLK